MPDAILGSNDPRLLVLISLAGGPRHGHAIMLDVAGFAGLQLGPGTLYGAIGRLEDDGLIEPLTAVGRRRPYRLTAPGREALTDRVRQLGRAIDTGARRLRRAAS